MRHVSYMAEITLIRRGHPNRSSNSSPKPTWHDDRKVRVDPYSVLMFSAGYEFHCKASPTLPVLLPLFRS